MGKFFDWLDNRTGYRKVRDALLIEHIPGGAKWRYVWGSTLVFVFMVQLITGILLMTAYVPGAEDAWGSVYFIQYEMDFGWLIRGLHHFGSQTMVVLMGIHMLQVVIAGAHLPPREINWWLGLALLGLVLGLSLTGYLLPWDQKGYYASQVTTNIIGNLPLIGSFLQKVLVGGDEYGHQTLTHFFALHVGILPPLVILFIVLHLVAFRRHGVTAPRNAKGEGHFWPDQAFRDMIVCLVIFGIMLALVVFGGHGHKIETPGIDPESQSVYDYWAKAGRDGRGANLDAPADPLTEGYPARPEWYFLFLFQLLKYFQGDQEILGTVVIPGAIGLLLFLLPLFGYGRMRPFGHFLGIVVVGGLLVAVTLLTMLAYADDSPDFDVYGLAPKDEAKVKKAKDFRKRLKEAEHEAQVAVQAASEGIPSEGGRSLVRGNPIIAGKKLFKTHCASCHAYDFKDPVDEEDAQAAAKAKAAMPEPKASDLTGFATKEWIRGLLENPSSPKYFGHNPRLQGMATWREGVDETIDSAGEKKAERKKEIDQQLDEISWWLAEQAMPPEDRVVALKEPAYKQRYELGKASYKAMECQTCHNITGEVDGAGSGPDLTGYGSAEWLHGIILYPAHRTRYDGTVKTVIEEKKDGKLVKTKATLPRNEMPFFRPPADNPGGKFALNDFHETLERYVDTDLAPMLKGFEEGDERNKERERLLGKLKGMIIPLSDYERELIVRYVMNDHRVVFGGQPISGPKKK